MKKALLILFFLVGISQSMNANNSEVTTVTFQTSTTSGNWTTIYTYTFIDFNGNGCLDQWETCILMSIQYIEEYDGKRYYFEL